MPKTKTVFHCQSCGASFPRWQGRCDACGAWNTLVEDVSPTTKNGKITTSSLSLSSLADHKVQSAVVRRQTGLEELDRVLGGGLTVGSVVLIGGEPGIGKSTLLLQAALHLSEHHNVAYLTGEESLDQIAQRAGRLEQSASSLSAAHTVRLEDVQSLIEDPKRPDIVIIDSIQTLHTESLESAPGTVSQIRYCTHMLATLAKKRGVTFFLVGHITKDGNLAGPKVLEHLVDTVLTFEGDRRHHVRLLRGNKNRYGATDEIGVFTMTSSGLQEITNPSALFLSDNHDPCPGHVVTVIMEGARPLLVDIEVLVCPTPLSIPRRTVVGWDINRLHMLIAVLEKRLKCPLSQRDVFVNVAGGLRTQEPSMDLAVCLALLSSLQDTPLPERTVVFGEIGLSGQARPVPHAYQRIREATRLGFTQTIAPPMTGDPPESTQLLSCQHLNDGLKHLTTEHATPHHTHA